MSGKDSDLIIKWLDHFQKFATYVQFFSFESFCDNNEIINLVDGKKIDSEHIKQCQKKRQIKFMNYGTR